MRRARWKWISAELKAELWRRWKAGEAVSKICVALGLRHVNVGRVLLRNGGYVPRERKRSERALTLKEREEISRGLATEESIRQIARRIGRAASTVSREIRRHGGTHRYRAAPADRLAWKRAERPKLCKLAQNQDLQRKVAVKLAMNWSPEQISGWLKTAFSA